MRSRRNIAIASALCLAWILIAAAMFLEVSRIDFVHGFVIPAQLASLESLRRLAPARYALDLFAAILGAIVFSAACVSLGLAVLRNWQKTQANYYAVAISAFLTGEIILSVVFLSCIVLYKLTPQIVAGSLVISLLLGLRQAIAFSASRPLRSFIPGLQRTDKIILGLVLAVLAFAMLYSSARLSYDAGVEYFSNAKMMAATHTAIYTFPKDLFPISSFHPGILLTAMIEVFGDQSARLLSWINGVLILLLGAAIGEELGLTPRARVWFLALMVTTTAFLDLLGDGKVDLISTAPLVACTYWMTRSDKEPSKALFGLIGLLAGFSMIARPYNLFLMPLFVLIFYSVRGVAQYRKGDFHAGKFLLTAAWMLPPMIVLGAFHLWQNWIWLGNPLAPLAGANQLNPITPLLAGAQANARVWWQWQFDPKMLNTYRILYPFTVSFMNSPQSLGNISPLFVGSIPFLLVRRVRERLRERPTLMWLTIAATTTLAIWVALFSTVMEIRYVLFLWTVVFLVMAQIMESAIESINSPLRVLLGPIVGLLLLFIGARTLIIAFGTYSPVDARGQAHCDQDEMCSFINPLNAAASPGERVFVLHAFRYYLRPDLFACSSRAQEYPKFESLAQEKSRDFWIELYREGFHYVTYETNYADFHTHFGPLPPIQDTPDWLHVTELSSSTDGLERTYQIEAVDAPLQPDSYCENDAGGIWQVKPGTPASQQ